VKPSPYPIETVFPLLRKIAGGQLPEQEDIEKVDWLRTKETIERHGLAPILYPAVKSSGCVPASITNSFAQRCENAFLFRDLCVQKLADLAPHMDGSGRIVVLQGLALWEYLYTDSLAREMSDIDLYLPDGNGTRLKEVLARHGFAPYRDYRNVWIWKGLYIDIHEDLWGADRIPRRSVFAPSRPPRFAASTMIPGYYVPEKPLLALHAIFHALKHAYSRAVWLFDLMLLVRDRAVPIPSSIDTCNLGASAMGILRDVGLTQQEEARSVAGPTHRTTPKQRLLKWAIENGERPGAGELTLALLCPSWRARLAYLLSSLLPSPQVLRDMYGQSAYPYLVVRRTTELVRKAMGFLT
jgi:hypothetical protein